MKMLKLKVKPKLKNKKTCLGKPTAIKQLWNKRLPRPPQPPQLLPLLPPQLLPLLPLLLPRLLLPPLFNLK